MTNVSYEYMYPILAMTVYLLNNRISIVIHYIYIHICIIYDHPFQVLYPITGVLQSQNNMYWRVSAMLCMSFSYQSLLI